MCAVDGYFSKREFNYTLMPGGNQSIYVRNQSYANLEEFRQDMTKAAPHKIDIGAIYSHPPRLHASYGKSLQAKVRNGPLPYSKLPPFLFRASGGVRRSKRPTR